MTNEKKYLAALREIELHIRSTPDSIQYIVETLLNVLPEHEVKKEDIEERIK